MSRGDYLLLPWRIAWLIPLLLGFVLVLLATLAMQGPIEARFMMRRLS